MSTGTVIIVGGIALVVWAYWDHRRRHRLAVKHVVERLRQIYLLQLHLGVAPLEGGMPDFVRLVAAIVRRAVLRLRVDTNAINEDQQLMFNVAACMTAIVLAEDSGVDVMMISLISIDELEHASDDDWTDETDEEDDDWYGLWGRVVGGVRTNQRVGELRASRGGLAILHAMHTHIQRFVSTTDDAHLDALAKACMDQARVDIQSKEAA